MAANAPAPYIAVALVRVVGAAFDRGKVFVTPVWDPSVASIALPSNHVIEGTLDRTRMAGQMYEALCRISESDSLSYAIDLAEEALAKCEGLQAREIAAEPAPLPTTHTLVDALQTPSPARDEAMRQADARKGTE